MKCAHEQWSPWQPLEEALVTAEWPWRYKRSCLATSCATEQFVEFLAPPRGTRVHTEFAVWEHVDENSGIVRKVESRELELMADARPSRGYTRDE